MNRFVWVVLLLIRVPMLVLGQTPPPQELSPVDIVSASVSPRANGPLLILDLMNRSSKPIVGYSMTVWFIAGEKQPVWTLHTGVRGVASHDPAKKYFQPKISWQAKIRFPAGVLGDKPFNHKVVLDYVLFEDGSNWGPDQNRESLYIRGLLRGWQDARGSLKALLDKKGVGAVIDELKNN